MVVRPVENVDSLSAGEIPVGDVCMPGFVVFGYLEANQRRLGPLLGLGDDDARFCEVAADG